MYPDLALSNPEPLEFVIPRKKSVTVKNPQTLRCSVVEDASMDTGYFNVSKLIDPIRFSQHKGFAYELFDKQAIDDFQSELNTRVKSVFGVNNLRKRGVVY